MFINESNIFCFVRNPADLTNPLSTTRPIYFHLLCKSFSKLKFFYFGKIFKKALGRF